MRSRSPAAAWLDAPAARRLPVAFAVVRTASQRRKLVPQLPGAFAMTALPCIRRLLAPLCLLMVTAMAAALSTALGGCASVAPPSPTPLLHDALFDHPPRPADADAVFSLSPAMQAHLDRLRLQTRRPEDLPLALAESLYQPGGLRLDYDASITRNAAEAFDARSGNCLSLVVMTTALARGLGLEVSFQDVRSDDQFRHEGDLTLRTGHVNLVLGERPRPQYGRSAQADLVLRQLVIDFLPQQTARGLPVAPIGQPQVLAMFMNNRAVEALLAHAPAQAYAWVREALRHDPGSAAAYNTLGVVYQRGGHLVPAAAAYEQVLAFDDRQVAAMVNLAQVRRAQGRDAEARAWEQRRAALEPKPPFHFLRLGQAALAAGDLALARAHFQRELRSQPESHEAWFGLARVHLAQGDHAQAEQALRQALAASATVGEQARYAGKLGALKAAAAH
jgi:Tfp pilus assembly protein PilF